MKLKFGVLGALGAIFSSFLVVMPIYPAFAESVTVQGTGAITKMSVNNAQDSLIVKVYGLNAPCRDAQNLNVTVKWGTTADYVADAICGFRSGNWEYGLFYSGEGKVNCPDFRMTYNSTGKFHRVFFPRSCIDRAANRVKVRAEGGDSKFGEAGPTPLLRRG